MRLDSRQQTRSIVRVAKWRCQKNQTLPGLWPPSAQSRQSSATELPTDNPKEAGRLSTPDLRQAKLLEPYERLTAGDRQHLHKIASDLNTLRRVEQAVRDGYVETQTYIPGFLADKDYIVNLQWFAFYAVRGYASQHRKPATLVDIYQRVAETVRSLQREGAWPRDWKFPSKRTIDRRVNEIASPNATENHIMDRGRTRVICTRAGEYLPNPALFEDIERLLAKSSTGTRVEGAR